MKIKVAIFIFLMIITVTAAEASETVTFKGTDTTSNENPFMLTGKLTKPQGEGPFPAVVCLHGCGGISRRDDAWVERLSSWGYVTLQVDSFGPRGKSNICTNVELIPPKSRAQDAHDAKSFLSGLPFVNKDRIAVMGWSHGGWTTLYTVNPKTHFCNRASPFRAAIAFYPYCDISLSGLEAPLLILIGDYDDWSPARMCSQMMPFRKTSNEVILKIYPKSYHGFDADGMDGYVQGTRNTHRMFYNPAAAADATPRVREFLERHLKQTPLVYPLS
jgi:dienelactone hydrolase